MSRIEEEEIKESEGNYLATVLIDKNKLREVRGSDLALRSRAIFKDSLWSSLGRLVKRKNIVYFNFTTIEKSLEIKDVIGTTNMQLLTEREIRSKIRKISSEEDRNKIGYIAIGGIKFS